MYLVFFFDCIMQIIICQGYKYVNIIFFNFHTITCFMFLSRTTTNKIRCTRDPFTQCYRLSTLKRCTLSPIYINLTKIISLSMLPRHTLTIFYLLLQAREIVQYDLIAELFRFYSVTPSRKRGLDIMELHRLGFLPLLAKTYFN